MGVLWEYAWVIYYIVSDAARRAPGFASEKDSRPVSRVLYAPQCMRGCLPFIHCRCHHRPLSFYPPARAGRPLFRSPVYMNFQLPGCTAPVSPLAWWALAPPSHPYPARAGRLFSSTSTVPRGSLSVRKRDALCCPDFPLALHARGVWASGRPACCPVICLQRYKEKPFIPLMYREKFIPRILMRGPSLAGTSVRLGPHRPDAQCP